MIEQADVDELRAWASGCGSRGQRLCLEAADEIERLRDYLRETSGRLHQIATDTSGLSPQDMRRLANDLAKQANGEQKWPTKTDW